MSFYRGMTCENVALKGDKGATITAYAAKPFLGAIEGMIMTAPVRAAHYLRISTGRQADSDLSIPDQPSGQGLLRVTGLGDRRRLRQAYCLSHRRRAARVPAMIDAATTKPPAFDEHDRRTRRQNGRSGMDQGGLITAVALVAVLCTAGSTAQAFDDAKYPDLRGQWGRAVTPGASDEPRFDPAKPPGRGQQPPLTAEYQAIFEANLREREAGVPGTWPGPSCLPPGMPAQMTAYRPLEFVVLPDVTYVRVDYVRETRRRIYTDGRKWPEKVEDGFDGYSIGTWIDTDNDGKYDVLEVETRHFKGPRAFDLSGIPLHEDNKTVIKERIFLDKADANLLHDEMTVTDHALTRPWTVMKTYRRSADAKPQWAEYMCVWESDTLRIGDETYLVDKEGYLRPAKKDQAPPSLKYFPAQR